MDEATRTERAQQQRTNEDLFDEMIDQICSPGSPWTYEEAVHIASDAWDERALTGPLPSDYVPADRRRHMTGGA